MTNTEQLSATTAIGNETGAFKGLPKQLPSDCKVRALPSTVRLAPADQIRSVSRAPIIALWFLKNGIDSGLITTKTLYKKLRDLAFKTQQNGDVAFFELYPDALILNEDEQDNADLRTRSSLMANYRKYCKRLAHFYYHYIQCSKLWTGATINTITLARLNGNERYKSIASAFKFTKWNSKTAQFASFPQLVGYTKSMLDAARIAVGHNTYGTEIAALPIILNSVFGNHGQHAHSVLDFITTNGSKTTARNNELFEADLPPDTRHASDARLATDLLENMDRTVRQYANAKTSVWHAAPRDPFIENGSTLSLVFDDTEGLNDYSGTINLNVSGNMHDYNGDGNFIGGQQGNYDFWQNVMFTFFADMRDPSHDKVVIAKDLLKIIEPQLSYQEMVDYNKKLYLFDIVSLANHMIYKKDAQINTATIVRYMPPITDDVSKGVSDNTFFSDNWERYDLESSDYSSIIRKSKAYPDIVPAVFSDLVRNHADDAEGIDHSDTALPFVLNTVSSTGAAGDVDYPVKAIYGKESTLLDIALNQAIDFTNQSVDIVGYSDTAAQKYIDSSAAFVAAEDPSFITVPKEPIIDTTDIFNCGFTILLSNDSADSSEWAKYFKQLSYFPNLANGTKTKSQQLPAAYIFPSDTWVPQLLAYDKPSGNQHTADIAHTANPGYMDYVKHACIFVGAALLNHPMMARGSLQSGNPVTYFNPDNKEISTLGLMSINEYTDVQTPHLDWLSGPVTDPKHSALQDLCTRIYNGTSNADYNYTTVINDLIAFASSTDDLAPGTTVAAVARPQHGLLFKWMMTTGATKGLALRYEQYTINPAYGPVAPITEAMPLDGLVPNLLGECDKDENPYRLNIPIANLNFGLDVAAGANSQNDSEQQSQMSFYSAFISNVNCAQFWLFFMDALHFKNVRAKPTGVVAILQIPDDQPGKIYFSTEAKASLGLLSRCTTEGAHLKSTRSYFNEENSLAIVELQCDTTNYDVEREYRFIVPPRIPRNSRKYDNVGQPVNTDKLTNESSRIRSGDEQLSNTGEMMNKTSEGSSNGKKKKKKFHKRSHNSNSSNDATLNDSLDINKNGHKAEFDGTLGQSSIDSAAAGKPTSKVLKDSESKDEKNKKASIQDLI